ncbi:IS110 family transposase [Gracilimonas mengyeensis]|uniref:Transposase n=1 Tax=Gracilimonas mengyeensis TaxID=1302730 RepID=A0A521B759_9BACT|nr:IS110 family transposase [Gracilimonas mengyeensis]SMO42895.1 Transposase [Gracilimonas mengyeensis]
MESSTFADSVNHFVGIDVSKGWLDCYLRPLEQYIRVNNDSQGFKQLAEWLDRHGADRSTTILCMENTGIYDDRLLGFLQTAGWNCAVEKTTVLDKVTPEHHRKDDAYDAAKLAEYADRYIDHLHLYRPTPQAVECLRQLVAERRRLVRQRAAVKTKQTQSTHLLTVSEQVRRSWQAQQQCYDEQITAIEQRIKDLIASHPQMSSYDQLLQSVPGVGEVTSWLWLILFYGQQTLDAKQIASRFGFAPHSKTSGSSIQGQTRSSGHGASQMRQCMTLAARSASTHYKKFRDYKQIKQREGKNWPIVRNNIINKLIKIMCAIWNSGCQYQVNHTSRFDQQKNAA